MNSGRGQRNKETKKKDGDTGVGGEIGEVESRGQGEGEIY